MTTQRKPILDAEVMKIPRPTLAHTEIKILVRSFIPGLPRNSKGKPAWAKVMIATGTFTGRY